MKSNNMTKMLLFLFAAGTVFAAPKFKIVDDAIGGPYAAIVDALRKMRIDMP